MTKEYSVVVIDDDRSLSYIVREGIDKLDNFNVNGLAHNGEDGITLIKRIKPDIVILDIVMPKSDGLDVLEYFKLNNKPDWKMEFIILSALDHDLVTKQALNLGAMYYVVKPFEISTLTSKLNLLFFGSNISETKTDETDNKKKLNLLINEELNSLGVPIHLKGYKYIQSAVRQYLEHGNELLKITKFIYPAVAEEYGTTSSNVERAIRHSIESMFSKGDITYIKSSYKNEIFNNKIRNKEFIVVLAKQVRLKL